MLTLLTDVFRVRWCINVVTLFTSPPDLSVVFSFVCLFLLLCVWCFFSLVAAAFLANKDVYKSVIAAMRFTIDD